MLLYRMDCGTIDACGRALNYRIYLKCFVALVYACITVLLFMLLYFTLRCDEDGKKITENEEQKRKAKNGGCAAIAWMVGETN